MTKILISDHFLSNVFVKPSNMYQRGPSYWNLYEKFLKYNASLIRKDPKKNFFEINQQLITKTLSIIFKTF